jgi:dTDP-4-amino-4,6-dideoxygalactose transaminase
MVDVAPNSCHVTVEQLRPAITARTKVIMPVDIGGLPIDYNAVMQLIEEQRATFVANNPRQEALGRILFLSDAAHSFGAKYKGAYVGNQADVTGFSFHAVKNLTTAEGGAVVLNLPAPFDNTTLKTELKRAALHGQTKDALSKTVTGGWRYDIVEAGYKCNLTDIHAAIGCVELERYHETLARRKAICERYLNAFRHDERFIVPELENSHAQSAYHLFMLRINRFTEEQRDGLIERLGNEGISTNVHFQPLPLLSFYKQQGFDIRSYPNAMNNYLK